MKFRRVVSYQTNCPTCRTVLQIDPSEIDFGRSGDQRLECPVCKGNVLVLQNGKLPWDVWPETTGEYVEDTNESIPENYSQV